MYCVPWSMKERAIYLGDDLSWRRFIAYENEKDWAFFLRKVRESMGDMLAIALYLVAAEDILKNEKKWLKQQAFLSERLDTLLHMQRLQPVISICESER